MAVDSIGIYFKFPGDSCHLPAGWVDTKGQISYVEQMRKTYMYGHMEAFISSINMVWSILLEGVSL